jgi:hypothetical protein
MTRLQMMKMRTKKKGKMKRVCNYNAAIDAFMV